MTDRKTFRIPLLLMLLAAVIIPVAVALMAQGGPTRPIMLGTVGEIPNGVQGGPDRDVPCDESTGKSICATPPPALTAAEGATAVPLHARAFEVSLDHLGPYRIPVGTATLARGVIERMSIALENADAGTYLAPVFYLELEDPVTKDIQPTSIYTKPRTSGPQRVNVYLRFDLRSFEPGASVKVSSIDVE